jgi:hypothetical protein
MGRRKKPTGEFAKVREALSIITKCIDSAEEGSGKQSERINAAIVGTETLWQELRYLGNRL